MPGATAGKNGHPSGPSVPADAQALFETLQSLPRAELLGLYDAALEAIECMTALAEAGQNPVTEVLGGADVVEEWAHFPRGDVIDRTTHSQYYYHAHAAEERVPGEHGHFHTFVRPRAFFPEPQPAQTDDASQEAEPFTHLIGISTDASGQLIRLFTTNRWVTGEQWYPADDVIGMLDRFDIAIEQPSPGLNRWVSAIVRLFRPQIVELIRVRDETIAHWRVSHPDRDVFEDRELQVTSEIPVDFLAQVRAIEAAVTGQPHS